MARDGRGTRKDIFEVLAGEHRLVAALLEKIEKACHADEHDQAQTAFEVMNLKLSAHAAAEEEVVYPALEEASEELAELMGEANEEHQLIEDKLEEISQLAADDPTWKAKFTVLKELVEHHVEDEEGDVFGAASKVIDADAAIDLADRFLAARREILGDAAEVVTEIDLEVMTKNEMLEKAREMGLEGTSKMTRDELAQALTHHR